MTLVDESEALHLRVRAFARGGGEESFDDLALAIAEYQRRHNPGHRRLAALHGAEPRSVDDIPGVTSDSFRVARVAVHDASLDEVRFLTSGTTGTSHGVHAMRSTETYRELSRLHGARGLLGWPGKHVVVALAEHPGAPPRSSLGFMMRHFMQCFDGRALAVDPSGAEFDADAPGRWLLSAAGVDVQGLRRAALTAAERNEPLLVLATSFALVWLLDALHGARVPAPKRTVVMATGGLKGRSREVEKSKLRRQVAHAFRIPPAQVVGEYGMTELTSQMYEGTLPGADLAGEADVYLPPAWLRVVPVDPVRLRPVADGEVGIARFVDLGNVDSALAVVTQDLVRRRGLGVELCGRRAGAQPRGCSLAVEELAIGRLAGGATA